MAPGMLSPEDPRAPKFWMNETGGQLQPAMVRYLEAKESEPDDITLIRAYLRQWIDSPVWDAGPRMTVAYMRAIAELRRDVRRIETRAHIDAWMEEALKWNIDPL